MKPTVPRCCSWSVAALICASLLGGARVHAQSRAPNPTDRRVLRVWHAYGDMEGTGLEHAARLFESSHPEARVELLALPFGAYASKLESAIPTGRGPDVFIDAHERIRSYQERGLLGVVSASAIDGSRYEPWMLEVLATEGTQRALPLALKAAALYYNDHILREPPRSIDDLRTARASLPPGVWPLVFEAESAYYSAAFLHAFGAQMIDERGRFAMVGPKATAAVELLRSLVRDKVVPEETSGSLVEQLFSTGRAAAVISGPWLVPAIRGRVSYQVIPLPLAGGPDGGPMRPFTTVEGAFVSASATDPELASNFIAFLAHGQGAIVRTQVARQIVAASLSDLPQLRDQRFITFRQAALSGVPMPTHPNMRAAFEPAARALRKVLRGDSSVSGALEEAARRFDEVTRPLPETRDPAFALVALGLFLLLALAYALERARATEVRSALRASIPAYRYVLLPTACVLLLVVFPLLVGAFTSLFAGHGTDLHYVGLANYLDILTARGGALFATGSFWLVLLVTCLWTLSNLLLHVALGTSLALLLHRRTLRMRGVYRMLLVLPWAVPSYVTALAWKGMFHQQLGAVNAVLGMMGVEPVSWFSRFSTAFTANLATNVWLGFPFMMVVTLGALSAIPDDLYEAASVDGATRWQQFKRITLPLLVPSLAPAVVMGAVWTFNMFNVVFLVSGGEPDGSTEILVSEAYRWAFTRSSQYGYAAAYAVLVFAVLWLATRMVGKRLDGAGATT